ncbi:MAG: hypothetical protein WD003_02105 [Candidatus Paceibacterota bacterium]
MLYIITGKDFRKVNATLAQCVGGYGGASLSSYSLDDFSADLCDECIVSQELFGKERFVVLDGVLHNKENETYIIERLSDIASSRTHFIIKEEHLSLKLKEKLQEQATKTFFLEDEESKIEKDFSIFSLTDAVGKRNKKNAWIALQRACGAGMGDEQIYSTLFWQAKILSLVAQAKEGAVSTKTLGLNPFVLQKTEGFLKHYSLQEALGLSSLLLDAYHNARKGKEELSVGLERIILSL